MSAKQKELLTNWKIDSDTVTCRGQASKILDTLHERARLNLATPAQVKWLRKYGAKDPHTMRYEDASAFLTRRWGNAGQKASPGNQHMKPKPELQAA